jgi:hypothetical protein
MRLDLRKKKSKKKNFKQKLTIIFFTKAIYKSSIRLDRLRPLYILSRKEANNDFITITIQGTDFVVPIIIPTEQSYKLKYLRENKQIPNKVTY